MSPGIGEDKYFDGLADIFFGGASSCSFGGMNIILTLVVTFTVAFVLLFFPSVFGMSLGVKVLGASLIVQNSFAYVDGGN